MMFHRAVHLEFKEGTRLEVLFRDGVVKSYDIAVLFERYPQLKVLEDRSLFCSGKLMAYGIVWNDDLDIETEAIYEDGATVRVATTMPNATAGEAVLAARARKGWSQKQLSQASGIDQSDISKIERGVANPSVSTLARIAEALGCELRISIAEVEQDNPSC